MSSITLAEAGKLSLDKLVAGVIENIVTVNPIFEYLPFSDIAGNSLRYNREKTLGDVQVLDVGDTITAKAPASYKQKNANLTTILGDAEVNGLVQAQRVGGDQVMYQIASKAKSVARKYQDMMVNGDSAVEGFDGLDEILADIVTEADNPGQVIDAAGAALSFQLLDELLNEVKSKNGQVDYLMMSGRQIVLYRALERALGGTQPQWTTSAGILMPAYAGVPIFRNDWIVAGGGSPAGGESVYGGCFDDGSNKVGMGGLTAATNMGIHVQPVGAAETKDEDIYRIKFYSGFAVYSELGIAKLDHVA